MAGIITFNSIQDQLNGGHENKQEMLKNFQFYPRSTHLGLHELHAGPANYFQFYPRSTREVTIITDVQVDGFQFYPRSTYASCTTVSKVTANFQFYPRSTRRF